MMVWQSFFLVSLKWKLCVLKVSRHHLVGNKIFKRFSHCINIHMSVDTFGFKIAKEIELSQNNTEFEMWASFWIPNNVRDKHKITKALDVWLLAIQISKCLLVVSWLKQDILDISMSWKSSERCFACKIEPLFYECRGIFGTYVMIK